MFTINNLPAWRIASVAVALTMILSITSQTAIGQSPQSSLALSRKPPLVEPADISAFGQVQVTSPERPVEKTAAPLAGWDDARTIGLAVTSQRPGEYVAQIVNTVYTFPTTEAATAALSHIPDTKSYAESFLEGGVFGATSMRLWPERHRVDGDGMHIYGVLLQNGASVIDVYMITFASTLSDVVAVPGSSYSDQAQQYMSALTREMAAGKTFRQLVDDAKSHALGKALMNHLVTQLIAKSAMLGVAGNSTDLGQTTVQSIPSPLYWYSDSRAGW